MTLGYAFYKNIFNFKKSNMDSGSIFPPCQQQSDFFYLTVLAKKAALYGVMRFQIKITNIDNAEG